MTWLPEEAESLNKQEDSNGQQKPLQNGEEKSPEKEVDWEKYWLGLKEDSSAETSPGK